MPSPAATASDPPAGDVDTIIDEIVAQLSELTEFGDWLVTRSPQGEVKDANSKLALGVKIWRLSTLKVIYLQRLIKSD